MRWSHPACLSAFGVKYASIRSSYLASEAFFQNPGATGLTRRYPVLRRLSGHFRRLSVASGGFRRGTVQQPRQIRRGDCAVIVPCANYIPSASGTQTNPLYSAPPNNHNPGTKLADHWGDAITGTHFQIAHAFGFYFLCAKVQPLHGPEAYINVWRGKSLESQQRGTMYCSLRSKPNCEHQCLCGDCKPEWLRQGWICRYMCWA